MAEEETKTKIPVIANLDAISARLAVLFAQRDNLARSFTTKSTAPRPPAKTEAQLAQEKEELEQYAARSRQESSAFHIGQIGKRQDIAGNEKLRYMITGKKGGLSASKPREDGGGKLKHGKRNREDESSDEEEGRSGLGKGKKRVKSPTTSTVLPKTTKVHPSAQLKSVVNSASVARNHVGGFSNGTTVAGNAVDLAIRGTEKERKRSISDNEEPNTALNGSVVTSKKSKASTSATSPKSILKKPPTPAHLGSNATKGGSPVAIHSMEESQKRATPQQRNGKADRMIEDDNDAEMDSNAEDTGTTSTVNATAPSSSVNGIPVEYLTEAERKKAKLREKKKRQKLAKKERERQAKSLADGGSP